MRTFGSPLAPRSQRAEEDRLDRALVTGLMVEVILETSTIQIDPKIHRNLVKTRLKNLMVTRLAGRVTLQRFHQLLHELDYCFPRYYPLINSGSPQAPDSIAKEFPVHSLRPAPTPPGHRALREDLLKDWLETDVRKLLPQRPHRKLSEKRLLDFLLKTQGGWFRLKDFEHHFDVDRKTAWEYLQKLLATGLLCHNHQRSAAVRYALAGRFLVVNAEALKLKVQEALPDLPQNQTDQICDWLVATGGEAFGESEWHCHLKPSRCRHLFGVLQRANLLNEVGRVGLNQMFQLPADFLQDQT